MPISAVLKGITQIDASAKPRPSCVYATLLSMLGFSVAQDRAALAMYMLDEKERLKLP